MLLGNTEEEKTKMSFQSCNMVSGYEISTESVDVGRDLSWR